MAENKMLTGLGTVPIYESGDNWTDFYRRMIEYLGMVGLGPTLDPAREPIPPSAPEPDAENPVRWQAAQSEYLALQKTYDEKLLAWEDKQFQACSAVRNRCGFNYHKDVQGMTRVYQILNTLAETRTTGAGRLNELFTKFYRISLADCKNVSELANTLNQVNNELKDLYSLAAFSTPQLIWRFFEALGPGYETFVATFQQTHNLVESPGKPAVDYRTVTQKAFDDETRQNSMHSDVAMLAVQGRTTGPGTFCTFCKKQKHTEAVCFQKHPHLKKPRDRKRKSKESGNEEIKKSKPTPTPALSEDQDIGAVTHNFSCLALDSEVSKGVVLQNMALLNHKVSTNTATTVLADEWVLDTGCTNHATGTEAHFTNITYGDFGSCGGVGGSVMYKGKGTVKIDIPGPNGKPAQLTLTDVKYCPSMGPFNLISVSQLFGKAQPVLTKDAIYWKINGHRINASARHGLWLLDQTK
jgi:hypothetical protein